MKAQSSESLIAYYEDIVIDYVTNNFNRISKLYCFFCKSIPSKNELIEIEYLLEKKNK